MKKYRRKKPIGFAVAFCLAAALIWAWQVRVEKGADTTPVAGGMSDGITGRKSFDDAVRHEIRKNFEAACDELNKGIAEKKEREPLALTYVEVGDGPSMTYLYTVSKEAMNGFSKENMRIKVSSAVCGVPEMRDYMQYGVYYTYVYQDEDGKGLFQMRVDDKLCTMIEQEAAKADGKGAAGSQAK